MRNLLIGLLGAGVIATGGYAAASSLDAEPARTVSLPGATTGDTTTGTTTNGATTGTTTLDTTTAGTTTDEAGDISGPCDEAEHANDPRCTGGTTTDEDNDDEDDNSGPGGGGDDDRDDDGDDEDRSGSNSGRG